jgi:hypothetical protein
MYSMMWPMCSGPFAYGRAVVTKSRRVISGIDVREGRLRAREAVSATTGTFGATRARGAHETRYAVGIAGAISSGAF